MNMTVSEINPFIRYAGDERHSISSVYTYAYDCRLLYLRGGCFTFECDGTLYEVVGGTLLLWQSGKRYRFYTASPIDAVILNFDFTQSHAHIAYMHPIGDREYRPTQLLEHPIFSDCPPLSEPLCLPDMREVEEPLTQLVREFHDQKCFYQAIASSLLKDVLTRTARLAVSGSGHFGDTVERVIAYIRENYALPITNRDISEQVNYHEFYVNKLMIKQTGTTLHHYLLQVRVQNAERLLSTTSESILHIAEQCGFSSASHFSNVFRRFTGESPLEYRQRRSLL